MILVYSWGAIFCMLVVGMWLGDDDKYNRGGWF